MSLERLVWVEKFLSLILTLLPGEVPEDLSISVLLVGNTGSKEDCCELDIIVELKERGKLNLFAIFPIGATMQDGGKRKRSNVYCHYRCLIYSTENIQLLYISISTLINYNFKRS